MFRTRDFVLVFTAVTFLVMAIGVTRFTQWQETRVSGAQLQPATVSDTEYRAIRGDSEVFSRSQKLQQMRDKIAQSSQLSITEPESIEIQEEIATTTATATSSELAIGVQLCPDFTPFNDFWSPLDIEIAETEGARLVYRALDVPEVLPVSVGTSSQPQVIESQRDILAQLPVRNFPAPSTSCIPSDVVGIATDGSLIRNNEASVYGIFDSTTQIGWALDGFPIYGSAAASGDACGGLMAIDGYRYQISPQRETILHCYSAAPIRL